MGTWFVGHSRRSRRVNGLRRCQWLAGAGAMVVALAGCATQSRATAVPGDDGAGSRAADALSGRLVFAAGEGHVLALDARTGATTTIELGSGIDDARVRGGALAPDGRRIAYTTLSSDLLFVADLTRPRRTATSVTGVPERAGLGRLLWTSDGRAIVYDFNLRSLGDVSELAPPTGWEAHLATFGTGIDAVDDQVLWRLEPDAFDGRWGEIVAWDAPSGRAVVLGGPGGNGVVDTIRIIDALAGIEVARFATLDEGYQALGSPDGRWVAVSDVLGSPPAPRRIRLVDVRRGTMLDVAALSALIEAFAWSSDGTHLAWTEYVPDGGGAMRSAVRAVRVGDDGVANVGGLTGAAGRAVAFAPGTVTLLTRDCIVDLATGQIRPIPWALPAGVGWDAFIGWAPAPAGTEQVTPTPAPPPSPAGGEIDEARTPATPILSAREIEIGDWSPDGRWLAVWVSDVADGRAVPFEPRRLRIVEVDSGRVCPVDRLVRRAVWDELRWTSADGFAFFSTDGDDWQGTACGGEIARIADLDDRPAVDAKPSPSPGRSPDGAFRATTDRVAADGGFEDYRTTIVRVADDREVVSAVWRVGAALGEMGSGGEWVAETSFLVRSSWDRGPLLLGTDGRVTVVATELFRVPLPAVDRDGYVFVAHAVPATDGEAFHLVLAGSGEEARMPSLRHYESFWGRVEVLPSKHVGCPAIVPGGRGIVFGQRYGHGRGAWVHRLNPDILGYLRLPVDGDCVAWTADGEWMAAGYGRRVVAARLPEDVEVTPRLEWDIAGSGVPVWSPDGRWLAFDGSRPIDGDLDGFDRGLFVVAVR